MKKNFLVVFWGLFALLPLFAQFQEIDYPLLEVKPYVWRLTPSEMEAARQETTFLSLQSLDEILQVDWKADALLYQSIMAFFEGDDIPDPAYLVLESGIRIECYRKEGFIYLAERRAGVNETVVLSKEGTKNYFVKDKVRDFFVPGNFVWRELDGKNPHIETKPAWPEPYLNEKIGDFSLLFVEEDRSRVLEQIDWKRLAKLPERCEALLGFSAKTAVTLIVPPNLVSFARLYQTSFGANSMKWWPLAFHSAGNIVLWPLSVPRYDDPEGLGQKYFWHKDLYRLIFHEYAHLAALDRAGCLNSLPVWLDEGMAVYLSADIENQISSSYPKLLKKSVNPEAPFFGLKDWESLIKGEAGHFEEAESQMLYLQGYAMVRYLIEEYGIVKLSAYVESFRWGEDWKNQFEQIYRLPWSENVVNFNRTLVEE